MANDPEKRGLISWGGIGGGTLNFRMIQTRFQQTIPMNPEMCDQSITSMDFEFLYGRDGHEPHRKGFKYIHMYTTCFYIYKYKDTHICIYQS